MIQKTYLFIYYIGEKFFKLQKIWGESGNFCKKYRRLLRRLRLLAMTKGTDGGVVLRPAVPELVERQGPHVREGTAGLNLPYNIFIQLVWAEPPVFC